MSMHEPLPDELHQSLRPSAQCSAWCDLAAFVGYHGWNDGVEPKIAVPDYQVSGFAIDSTTRACRQSQEIGRVTQVFHPSSAVAAALDTYACLRSSRFMPNLLLIDDDPDFTARLARGLQSDHSVTCLDEATDSALERLAKGEFALVLLDNQLPKMPGLEFLRKLEERGVTVPVILVTGDGDPRTIIDAINRGAFDYVQKRETAELLKVLKPLIRRALEIGPGPPVSVPGIETPAAAAGLQLIGSCAVMTPVYRQIARVARIAQPVLIVGEAGTGKDLVARAIHNYGPRRDKPFVVVRCHTFDDDLLRDELFGHEIGFRGEGKLRKGKFEYASGGTLYLDDVSALPRALQDDVLRVLEERQVTRLGDNEPIPVNVRVLAASRRDLQGVPEAKFRCELLGQLASETIHLPSLSARFADLELLANHFLQQETALAGKTRAPSLAAECWDRLRKHTWSGNIRELQTVLRRAVVRSQGPQILARDLSFDEPNAEPQILAGLHLAISSALGSQKRQLYGLLLDMLRKELVALTLEECNGDTHEAEGRLGVSLDDILTTERPPPALEPSLPKEVERRIKALVLIETYPEWTVEQFAEKLKCSTATLYRDPLINRALDLRKRDRRIPRGHKTRDGGIEAYSQSDD
jgi:DNA-binding NtrC family response regulator